MILKFGSVPLVNLIALLQFIASDENSFSLAEAGPQVGFNPCYISRDKRFSGGHPEGISGLVTVKSLGVKDDSFALALDVPEVVFVNNGCALPDGGKSEPVTISADRILDKIYRLATEHY